MGFKNERYIIENYKDEKFLNEFIHLFSLRMIFLKSGFSKNYVPSADFSKVIFLTPDGVKIAGEIVKSFPDLSDSEIKFSLFIQFYYHELFVDVLKTDWRKIRDLIGGDLKAKKIILPWIHFRNLYDRFFEFFKNETRKLSLVETEKLLEGSSQGVFQFFEFVTGPFGLLKSNEKRFMPIESEALLWHCSDPSCSILHSVELSLPGSNYSKIFDFISKICRETSGMKSEWFKFYKEKTQFLNFYDHMHPGAFPKFFVNSFSEKEIKLILKSLLRNHLKNVMKDDANEELFKQLFKNKIKLEKLNLAECFQLVLVFSNDEIIEIIEKVIEANEIYIPPTELRRSEGYVFADGWFRIEWQCSRFGVRSVSKIANKGIAISRLKVLIKELYKEDLSKLEWKIRHVVGSNVNEKIEKYLYEVDPRKIIIELIFTEKDNLEKSFSVLGAGCFDLTINQEEFLIDKILWKLGFDISSFPEQNYLFEDRSNKLLNLVEKEIDSEADRENIRSVAVNYFVSLEEILEQSLSFSTWVLLSDHYSTTKFKYRFKEARKFMAETLNEITFGSERLKYDLDGKNTLFPLVRGFSILSVLCEEKIKNERKYIRENSKKPSFQSETNIQLFPFQHDLFLLDLSNQDIEMILVFLKKITSVLENIKTADVRNRIEHKRGSFPKSREIKNMCVEINKLYLELVNYGVCPTVYFYAGETIDEYDRRFVKLRNYKNDIVVIMGPSQYDTCNLPNFDKTLVVVPCMKIGDSDQLIRFEFSDDSEFFEMWKNYPRKRKLPAVPIEPPG